MKRLTGYDGENVFQVACFENGGCIEMGTDKCFICEHQYAVYKKLADYEETGLAPMEVSRANDFEKTQSYKLLGKVTDLLAENALLTAQIDTLETERDRLEGLVKDYEYVNENITSLSKRWKAQIEQLEAELAGYQEMCWCRDCEYYTKGVCCNHESDWTADYPPKYCSCEYCKRANLRKEPESSSEEPKGE